MRLNLIGEAQTLLRRLHGNAAAQNKFLLSNGRFGRHKTKVISLRSCLKLSHKNAPAKECMNRMQFPLLASSAWNLYRPIFLLNKHLQTLKVSAFVFVGQIVAGANSECQDRQRWIVIG